MGSAGVGSVEVAAGAAQARPAGVLADPSRAHFAVRPEIINKTPPRSHVRALPVLSARLFLCLCVAVLVCLRQPWTHLQYLNKVYKYLFYKNLFYRLACLRRCLLGDSGVGALVSSLKEKQAGEEVVQEVLREEVRGACW